jgi:hypothetical protein
MDRFEDATLASASPDLLEAAEAALPALVLLGNYIGNAWGGGGGIEAFDRTDLLGSLKAAIAKAKS